MITTSRLYGSTILYLISLLVTASAQGSPPSQPTDERCHEIFAQFQPLAGFWGISAREASQLSQLKPELRSTLSILGNVAQHFNHVGDKFYEDLGLLISFQFRRAPYALIPFPELGVTIEQDRLVQVLAAHNFAEDQLIMNSLPETQRNSVYGGMASLFDGVEPTIPWTLQPLEPAMATYEEAVATYLKARKRIIPELGTLMQHSEVVLRGMAAVCTGHLLRTNENVDLLIKLWQEDHKGFAVEVPFELQTSFEILQGLADKKFPRKKPDLHFDLLVKGLTGLLGLFAQLARKNSSFTDSYQTYEEWTQFIQSSTYIDSQLNGFLKSLFVEVVMKRPTLAPQQVKNLLQRNLRVRLKVLSKQYRALVTRTPHPPSPPTLQASPAATVSTLPSRQERIQAYQEAQKEHPNRDDKVDASPTWLELGEHLFRQEPPQPRPGDASLPTHAEDLKNQIYYVQLARTGMIYRLKFSDKVRMHMTQPKESKMPGYEHWSQAIHLGPALEEKQRGWKPLNPPYYGIYNWQIKLRGSPWRLLGFRDGNGVWHFERFYYHK